MTEWESESCPEADIAHNITARIHALEAVVDTRRRELAAMSRDLDELQTVIVRNRTPPG